MSFNPLIPHIPAFLSFVIYGFLTGFFFLFWKRSRAGCLITIAFWYVYIVWGLFFFALLGVEKGSNQVSFVGGFAVSFARIFWEHRGTQEAFWLFSRVADWFRDIPRLKLNRKTTTEQERPTAGARSSEQDEAREWQEAMRREQAAREAEASSRRAKAEEEARRREETNNPGTMEDERSYEQVLGLNVGWTPEDLKTAYRREAQRLHPDKWVGKPEKIRQAMEAEYKKVQEAYRALART